MEIKNHDHTVYEKWRAGDILVSRLGTVYKINGFIIKGWKTIVDCDCLGFLMKDEEHGVRWLRALDTSKAVDVPLQFNADLLEMDMRLFKGE